ncbi:MAG: hydroxysqualene dehydroxylase HpnE [Betaproteobacteria bacterium]
MQAPTAHGDVAVIGGGWAGLAAAVTLAEAGMQVTVFEAAKTLGGRARRVELDGRAFDNGQHLLLGAYRTTLKLIDQVHPPGSAGEVYARLPLCLLGPGKFRLRAARLPAPLHMLAGLLGARDCTLTERLAVAGAFAAWKRAGWRALDGLSVEQLLKDQPPRMIAWLWLPLCLAALNTPPAGASAQVFLNVLRDTLAAGRADSDLIIPTTDLSGLFPDPAERYVQARGGSVLRATRVRALSLRDANVVLELGGERHSFRDVIVAVAPWQAVALLDTIAFAKTAVAQLRRYEYQPITTVYLRYAHPVSVPFAMLQLGGGPGQWVFDRGGAQTGGSLLAVVISAEGPHRQLAPQALIAALACQLHENLPSLPADASPVWSQIITERRATHASTPRRLHPLAEHIGSGLYLAGDHTDPDYPATLEAATRSGVSAARALLQRR